MSSTSTPVATNIVWHEGITQTQRDELTGQKGVTVWFTGLSGKQHLYSQFRVVQGRCMVFNGTQLDLDALQSGSRVGRFGGSSEMLSEASGGLGRDRRASACDPFGCQSSTSRQPS